MNDRIDTGLTADGSDYLIGFGNQFATEAVPGALPVGRNSPQHVPFGLYAEQLSGTAFTAPRHESRHSWLYRICRAANHPPFIREIAQSRNSDWRSMFQANLGTAAATVNAINGASIPATNGYAA